MRAPLIPGREASRWIINGLAAVEFARRGDLDPGGPLGELIVGHGPCRVRRGSLAPIDASALLGRGEFEATVGLVKSVAPGATGFANAVLRTIAAEPLDAWLARLAPPQDQDPVGHLSLTHSHPPWIVRAFADALDGDLAEVARLLAEDNEPPPVHLCARPGRVEAEALADEVGGDPGAFSPYAVYLPRGAPGELAAVVEGRAHVQDEGSQLVTLALTEAPVSEGPAEQWLDLCAGPGGKAALLGALAARRGVTVTAVEVAEHRARLVERTG